ncbi:phenylacetate--CoA ligase family protein [Halomontanus rarus]|uniref:phenylacetate--CoA ligase family protein n=1 Tax=Halomontanus rarus TaxID=3034020 RepID=UPI0023E88B19|nr:phenylacetate--CoA ligase family protein [Halovivax sp. TS33]
MIYNTIHKLIKSSPEPLKKGLKYIPIKYRLGGSDFGETYEQLKNTEFWSKERLKEHQENKLQSLLEHAVENVPFYSDITLTSDDPRENLQKFPIIDKKTMRDNKDKFKAENISAGSTYQVTTGGTSGTPFRFPLDNSTYGSEWAYIINGWERVDYSPGDRIVSFRGISLGSVKNNKYWEYNPIFNSTEMSSFHMTSENLPYYFQKVQEVEPNFLYGYPSAISTFAKFMEDNGYSLPNVKAVFLASEGINTFQRVLIQRVLDAHVFSHYGQSEKVALGVECEFSDYYHFYPQYGLTEILTSDNTPAPQGEEGEIVGTGFLNRSMPFIRYRTGDFAVRAAGTCECGREYPRVKSLTGHKSNKRVVGPDGSLFSINLLYYSIHDDTLSQFYKIQFIQNQPGQLLVKVVSNDHEKTDERKLTDAIKRKCGEEMKVHVTEVDEVELTESGKQKLFIQNIDAEAYGEY